MKKTQKEHKQKEKMNIDWNEIKIKVNSLQESLNNIHSKEEKHSILKARAKVLAVEKKDETAQKDFIEIVVFKLASETYGIESSFIGEVYPLKDFTILPGTPSFVLGIINVRGQIVSIIDLKKFFNLPGKGLGELNKVIIIHNEKMEFGILADIIQGACSLSIEEIQIPHVSTHVIDSGYLKGISKDHIIILDAERILEDEKIIIHQESE